MKKIDGLAGTSNLFAVSDALSNSDAAATQSLPSATVNTP
jgi:hypothetical protein